MQYMVDVILDIKNNKRKLVQESSGGDSDPMFKAVRSFVLSKRDHVGDPLRISLQDLLDVETKGMV